MTTNDPESINPPRSTNPAQSTNPPRSTSFRSIITAAVIVLALLVGLYLSYLQFFASPKEGVVLDVGEPTGRSQWTRGQNPAAAARRAARPAEVDGIEQMGAVFRVKSGNFVSLLTPDQASGKQKIQINFAAGIAALAGADEAKLLRFRRDLVANPDLAKKIALTDDQKQQLQGIPARQMLLTTDEQQTRFREAWAKYLAADPNARQDLRAEVLAVLNEVGTASVDSTKADFSTRAQRVKSILTPDQLNQLSQ